MDVLFVEKTQVKEKKTKKNLKMKCGFSSPSQHVEPVLQVLAIGYVTVFSQYDSEEADPGRRANLTPPFLSLCRTVTPVSSTHGYIYPQAIRPDGIILPAHGPATGTTSAWILISISKPTAS